MIFADEFVETAGEVEFLIAHVLSQIETRWHVSCLCNNFLNHLFTLLDKVAIGPIHFKAVVPFPHWKT